MSEIKAQQAGFLFTITLNRPDAGNRLTDAMVSQLAENVQTIKEDVKLIVLRGAGKDFCLGRDLSAFSHDAPLPEALALRHRNEAIFECYNAFRRSSVPVLAVVQGRALGFGCALAAIADITIGSEDARFQFPEMSHRIFPGMAMSALVDRVSMKAILYLIISNSVISAHHALAIGLLSEVAPVDSLEGASAKFIDAVIAAPRPGLIAAKEYARNAAKMDVQHATDYARNLHVTINTSSEMRKT